MSAVGDAGVGWWDGGGGLWAGLGGLLGGSGGRSCLWGATGSSCRARASPQNKAEELEVTEEEAEEESVEDAEDGSEEDSRGSLFLFL